MPAVTNLANKLVRKGYIQREIPEHDRRLILLSLTSLGETVLGHVNAQHEELMNALWGDFSGEELERLQKSFNKMDNRLTVISEASE